MFGSRSDAKEPGALSALWLGSLVLPLVGAVFWGIWSYDEQTSRALETAGENVALIRQYTQRVVQTQTILHDAAQAHVQGRDPQYLQEEDFHLFLGALEASQNFTLGLTVLDLEGRVLATSRYFPANHMIGQRDYLKAIREGETIYIDRFIMSRTREDAIIVASPFEMDGFRGVIASAVAVAAVSDFLASIASLPAFSAALMRDDGKLLMRNVPFEPMLLDGDSPAVQNMRERDEATYRTVAQSDGIERHYVISRIGNLPIFASFGVPLDLIRTRWLTAALPVWALMGATAALSVLLAVLTRRGIRNRAKAIAHQKRLDEAERLAEQRVQLMQELNHRVKNNLALIEGLIGMQLRRQGAVDGVALRARVHAIAEVHDLLYKATDAFHIDFAQFLRQICASSAVIPPERNISVDLDLQDGVLLSPDSAAPLALIAVELITNAVKHAFPGRDGGTIRLRLTREAEGNAVLTISDDGVGLPSSLGRSSGMRIIEALSRQIEGTLDRTPGPGTGYVLTFPIKMGLLATIAPQPAPRLGTPISRPA